jgi:hypothetical protein
VGAQRPLMVPGPSQLVGMQYEPLGQASSGSPSLQRCAEQKAPNAGVQIVVPA